MRPDRNENYHPRTGHFWTSCEALPFCNALPVGAAFAFGFLPVSVLRVVSFSVAASGGVGSQAFEHLSATNRTSWPEASSRLNGCLMIFHRNVKNTTSKYAIPELRTCILRQNGTKQHITSAAKLLFKISLSDLASLPSSFPLFHLQAPTG